MSPSAKEILIATSVFVILIIGCFCYYTPTKSEQDKKIDNLIELLQVRQPKGDDVQFIYAFNDLIKGAKNPSLCLASLPLIGGSRNDLVRKNCE